MSLRLIDYQKKRSKSYKGLRLMSIKDDTFELEMGIEEGTPVIQIVAPWGSIYELGKYETEFAANKAMDRFEKLLERRYGLRIIDSSNAKLVPFKGK